MKAMELSKKVDELGRVVLPAEVRRLLDLGAGDAVSFFAEEGRLLLKKTAPSCLCCQSGENLKKLPNDTYLCTRCLGSIE